VAKSASAAEECGLDPGYPGDLRLRSVRLDLCIPTLAAKPPSGPGWVHEIKHDGYRLIVRRDGEAVRLFTRRKTSVCVTIVEGFAHRVDRDSRNHAREKEPGDTNRDCKRARESLPRGDIAIANREAGDEGEIDRITDGPALKKANHQAKGNLDREYYR
jgi:hypothetical protein